MKNKRNTGKKSMEPRKRVKEEGNLLEWQQQLGEGGGWVQKAYPLCHLGKEREVGGRGLLEIS